MKEYLPSISVNRNGRGVLCLDTIVGCPSGMANEPGGCYGDCYAANAAKRYGYDFSKPVLRDFEGAWHVHQILHKINNSSAQFVRIGCIGDPSEDWEHTCKIMFQIEWCRKEIVIITRHWNLLTDAQLIYLSGLNLCINTSISALDKPAVRERCLAQYHRIKPHLKSVLRIVSADFNLDNVRGHELAKIQAELFKNENTLDTVLRVGRRNQLARDGVVILKPHVFNGRKTLASRFNPDSYMGKCGGCTEQCGVGIGLKHQNRPGVKTQPDLFRKPSRMIFA